MALGSLIGTGIGGAAGLIAGGGNPMTAKIGAGLGSSAGSLVEGAIKKKQAKGLTPPAEDFERRSLLSEVNRKKKQLESGGTEFQIGSDILKSGLAQTQSNIVKAGGGNVGATMSGLAGSTLATNEATNKLIAQNQQQVGKYEDLANSISKEISDRRYKQALQLRSEKMKEASELTSEGMQNLGATAVGAIGGNNLNLSTGFNKLTSLIGNKSNNSFMKNNTDTIGGEDLLDSKNGFNSSNIYGLNPQS